MPIVAGLQMLGFCALSINRFRRSDWADNVNPMAN